MLSSRPTVDRAFSDTSGEPPDRLQAWRQITEQLPAVRAKIDSAHDAVDRDAGASPVLVAALLEFARQADKAVAATNERVAVIELEQPCDSTKAPAEADSGLSPATRDAILEAHLAICVAKSNLEI
jgi:hypothetical protein